jgi:hypothetical protein
VNDSVRDEHRQAHGGDCAGWEHQRHRRFQHMSKLLRVRLRSRTRTCAVAGADRGPADVACSAVTPDAQRDPRVLWAGWPRARLHACRAPDPDGAAAPR